MPWLSWQVLPIVVLTIDNDISALVFCQTVQNVGVPFEPPDDVLLGAADVADWLDVDEDWLATAVARDELPVMGYTSAGEPIVAAGEVRAWLRRPDPHADET
jgi:hypothetical protein